MNITVCFKTIADVDLIKSDDWQCDDHLRVDTSFVPSIINPSDESALETALKLSDSSKQTIFLHGLTVGNQQADRILKNLYALHFDLATRIDPKMDLDFNPDAVARLLAACIKQFESPGLILMGNHSPAGDNAMVPYLLAEELNLPCISPVNKIEWCNEGNQVEVESQIGQEKLIRKIKTPAILVLGNMAKSYLRVPTLKDRMAAGKKEVNTPDIDYTEVISNSVPIEPVSLMPRNQTKNCQFLDTQSIEEIAVVILKAVTEKGR